MTASDPPDMAQIRVDHATASATHETTAFDTYGRHRFGESYKQGYRRAWWDAINYVLTTQNTIDNLTAGQLLTELRKGPGSLFWPLKSDDPTFHVDCPRCRTRVLIDREGICSECGHDFQEQT